ncbi:MAG: hypothetical protein KAS59_04535 [Alphaproteobacteria bacterium]|nr:hypothetical protein [Alphaproteobacteria bacterium]
MGEEAKEIFFVEVFDNAVKGVKVGDHMPDGTVCFDVNPEKNTAKFVPEDIFVDNTTSGNRWGALEDVNNQRLHGHSDWRLPESEDGKNLVKEWGKVAPSELQRDGNPLFWGEGVSDNFRRIREVGGNKMDDSVVGYYGSRFTDPLPVTVVRSVSMTFNPK